MRDGKNITTPVTLEAMGSRDKSGNETSDAGRESPAGESGWATLLPMCVSNCRRRTIFTARWSSGYNRAVPRTTPGLQQGDVILEVDRKPVQMPPRSKNALGSVPKGQDALVLVWSNGGNTFRVLHPTELARLIAVRNCSQSSSQGGGGSVPPPHFFEITWGQPPSAVRAERARKSFLSTLNLGSDFLVSLSELIHKSRLRSAGQPGRLSPRGFWVNMV